jgi:hypothetical protein
VRISTTPSIDTILPTGRSHAKALEVADEKMSSATSLQGLHKNKGALPDMGASVSIDTVAVNHFTVQSER